MTNNKELIKPLSVKILITILVLVLTLKSAPIDNKKILYTNLIGSATIVTWGIINWDYGKRKMHTSNEGWFGKDTKHGGADKLGHFYTTYLLSHYFSNLYYDFGYDKQTAIQQGVISSLVLNTIMEVGDSFSSYGFSYEDFVINILGSYVGYYLLQHPDVHKKLDLRLQYKPTKKITSGDSYDVLTDYNGMKSLIAVKFDGFDKFANTYMKYFEFHIGYYVRDINDKIKQYPYIAIGINLSHLLKPVNKKVSRFFNYYQLPYSYIPN
jgi:hypothetical protein